LTFALAGSTSNDQSGSVRSRNGVLTYMSSSAKLKARIKQLRADKRLSYLPPLLVSSPMLREIFVSEEIRHDVSPPWPLHRTGARHTAFRETLDNFTQGFRLSVSEDPFRKPGYASMARTDPVAKEVWDIRCLRLDQGIRCFGCFAARDLFIALTWDYRENITDFDEEVRRCRQVWDDLFLSLQPRKKANLHEYLSNYLAV
jgi:hypothetical protein